MTDDKAFLDRRTGPSNGTNDSEGAISALRAGSTARSELAPTPRRSSVGPGKRLLTWWRRDTIAMLCRGKTHLRPIHAELDLKRNEESRLAADDQVHFAGLVLVELFTPSTASNLNDAMRAWRSDEQYNRDINTALERNKDSIGRASMGYVRPPGQTVLGSGHTDPTIPAGVQAIWLSLHRLTPSVSAVTATFTISEDSGDLSDLLRADYITSMTNGRIVVLGKMGRLRARIPWARPKYHRASWTVEDAYFGKRKAIANRIEQIEDQCSAWFFDRFPGKFAPLAKVERPSGRLMITKNSLPLLGHRDAYDAAGIGTPLGPRYRGDETYNQNWWLATSTGIKSSRPRAWTFATRRSDHENESGMEDTSNWTLTQRFTMLEQDSLTALNGLSALVELSENRVSRLRDGRKRTSQLRRPVRQARELNRYLLIDGLDAAALAEDLSTMTARLWRFRIEFPDFKECTEADKGDSQPPRSLLVELRRSLRVRGKGLVSDTSSTLVNLLASAELQQAVANTRLQRIVIIFTLVAIILSLIALWVDPEAQEAIATWLGRAPA